jgi:hypothetical protein
LPLWPVINFWARVKTQGKELKIRIGRVNWSKLLLLVLCNSQSILLCE